MAKKGVKKEPKCYVQEKQTKYILIRDSREKKGCGWNFEEDDDCAGTIVKKLDEGDYTLQGLESTFIIERKGNFLEFYQNIGKNRDRFSNEVDRLRKYKYVFLIIEDDFINVFDCPPFIPRMKFSPSYIISNLIGLQVKHNIHCVFIGKGIRATDYVKWLCKKMWQYYLEGRL